jgi:hypothetical protein
MKTESTEKRIQHTPGPWKATELDSGLWNVHAANRPVKPPICALDFSPEDAHLIAAAPEMLEALEYFMPQIQELHSQTSECGIGQCDCPLAQEWRKAEALIRKARGEK